jgi:hypothetical protein
MNEPAGAGTMVDSSGNGINGSIGSAIRTGPFDPATSGYHWSSTNPNGCASSAPVTAAGTSSARRR